MFTQTQTFGAPSTSSACVWVIDAWAVTSLRAEGGPPTPAPAWATPGDGGAQGPGAGGWHSTHNHSPRSHWCSMSSGHPRVLNEGGSSRGECASRASGGGGEQKYTKNAEQKRAMSKIVQNSTHMKLTTNLKKKL